jgi:hypothetical protein
LEGHILNITPYNLGYVKWCPGVAPMRIFHMNRSRK